MNIMKAFDIVAYAVDGALYCAEHHTPEDTSSPVFASDEGWQDHCCDDCVLEAIESNEQCDTLGESLGGL